MLLSVFFLASDSPSADVRRFECGFLSNSPAYNTCWLLPYAPYTFFVNPIYVIAVALRMKAAGHGTLHTGKHPTNEMILCKRMNPYWRLDLFVKSQHSSARQT